MKSSDILKKRNFLGLVLFSLILMPFLFACGYQGNYGGFVYRTSVEDVFESGQILDDHTYYYIGPDAEPVAIMAIDNAYELAPSLWKKIDLTPETLDLWNLRIDNQFRRSRLYKGALIVDQDKNRLGIWYSYLRWTTIKRGEGNQVIIYTPDTTKKIHKNGGGLFWSSL